jgi:D-alanine--D-alanine ligase
MQLTRIGVIMGGFSAERHISVESGRNIYEKLASSAIYAPIPIFLTGTPSEHQLFILPINILLKDSADDIHEKLRQVASDSVGQATSLAVIQAEAANITRRYAGMFISQPQQIAYAELASMVDSVFIALHGRPGEDGLLQAILEHHHIPYNGSGVVSSQRTIDKFDTNQFLRSQGIPIAEQALVIKGKWEQQPEAVIQDLEARFSYPFIAKPVDEGCSAAVVKIKNRTMLEAYALAAFRAIEEVPIDYMQSLDLKPQAAFPRYERFLVEALIAKGDAKHFLEITGGLLTHFDEAGNRYYEMFEPSESVALEGILSVEEKFLAGEGQNITPARYHAEPIINQAISRYVKQELEKVARLLDIEGYARIDAFVKAYSTEHIEVWIVEVNSLPGMTPATCIFHQCALNGYTPFDFIHQIIQYGLKKHHRKFTG